MTASIAVPIEGETEVADPILAAKRGDLETFLADYDPQTTPFFTSGSTGQTVLFGALANRDPATRVAMANRLLDDGADASVVTTSGVTLLHVLLTQRDQDLQAEAPLLARLVEAGADINKPDPKRGAPLAILAASRIPDAEAEPMYRPFFARPDLDLDAPASQVRTVRELILGLNPDYRPRLQQLVRDHDAGHGASDD